MIRRPSNPTLLPTAPLVPPAARSRTARGLAVAATQGRFALQVCADCGRTQYPPREACVACLGAQLAWRDLPRGGALTAATIIRISTDPYFRLHTPWRMGTVRLDCGVDAMAHLHRDCVPGARVRLALKLDKAGQGVMLALPETDQDAMQSDPKLREFICDPAGRRVLVSDGRTAFGQAAARALIAAGAEVFLGIAAPWHPFPGQNDLPGTPVPLDLSDTVSVHNAAAAIAARTDIIVNTAGYFRPGAGDGRAAMEASYFAASRLAQIFLPALRARGGDGTHPACAWVNMIGINGLVPDPAAPLASAANAATLALVRALRPEMRPLKLINAFVGPLDDQWHEGLPPPKTTPAQFAQAVIAALRDGTEEIAVGDIARHTLAQWHDNAAITLHA